MRKFFAKIHLWLSIPFGIIIAIVCLTGSILVFEKEILELRYPSHYFVKEVKGDPLAPETLISLGRQQLPDSIKINGIRITSDPKRTYQLVLPARKSVAFINPYTGEVTGIDDGKGFFLKIMQLHRWLLDEYKRDGSFSLGKSIVGYSTLVLVIIIISGVVIWYPRNKRALKSRLRIKTKSGWHRFFYDLHVSGGFYATLLLLALALTGLTWSFGWYRNAFYSVFGINTTEMQAHAPAPTPPAVTTQQTEPSRERGEGRRNEKEEGNEGRVENNERRKGREDRSEGGRRGRSERGQGNRDRSSSEKKTDYTQWAEVFATLQSRYSDFNSITIQDGSAIVSTAKYGNTRGSDRYSFDPVTGRITETQLYKDLPKSSKIRGWIYSVHVGSWGGITTRILSCLASFLGAVFVITGYYLWIKKKIRKRK